MRRHWYAGFAKWLHLLFSCVRVCVRAFQQRCCFFAVTSVTRREKNGQKFSETQEVKRDFRYLLPRTNPTRITSLLIFIQRVSAMAWKPVKYNFLVTLVTAKSKNSCDACVRVRARGWFYRYFYNSISPFFNLHFSVSFIPPPLHSKKRAVTSHKTTRCFHKTSRCFS